MPRIRERKHQEQAVAVTPWMPKKASTEGSSQSAQRGGSAQQLMYSVVLADAQLATPSTSLSADMRGPFIDRGNYRRTAIASTAANTTGGWHAVRKRPCSTPSLLPTSLDSKEQPHSTTAGAAGADTIPVISASKRRKQPSQVALKLQEALQPLAENQGHSHNSHDLIDLDAINPNSNMVLSDCFIQQQQDDIRTLHPSQELQGVAQIIILPSGTIAGHFIAQKRISCSRVTSQHHHQQQQQQILQPPVCLGLHGKQILGIHSCYRDPEWALLQLSVIKYGATSNAWCTKAGTAAATQVDTEQDKAKPCSRRVPMQHSSSSSSGEHADEAIHDQRHYMLSQRDVVHHADAGDAGHGLNPCSSSEQHAGCRLKLPEQQEEVFLQDAQQQQQHHERPVAAAVDVAVASAPDPPAKSTAAIEASASMSADETTSDSSSDDPDMLTADYASSIRQVNGNSSSSSSSSIESEVTAWVQRTGGDLVTLSPADMDDEDTAAVVLQDNLGLDPDFVHVEFKAHTLLAGADADKVLQQSWPQLVGQQDVVVNLGRMTVRNLPAEWL